MEKVKIFKLRHHKTILLLYSILETLFCAGPIYGWASLAYVLKKEDYFREGCVIEKSYNHSSNTDYVLCNSQEQKLNIAYTVAFLAAGVISLPAGSILDLYGPKVSRIVSSVFFAAAAVLWGNFSKDSQNVIYPALISISFAGVFSSFAFLQVTAFVCDKHQSTILGLQNGAFNASAVILQIIKILYEAQSTVKLEALLSIYCGISAVLVLVTTITIIPSKAELFGQFADYNVKDNAIAIEESNLCRVGDSVHSLYDRESIGTVSNIEENKVSPDKRLNTPKDSQDLLQLEMGTEELFNEKLAYDESFPWTQLQSRKNWSVGNLANANEGDNMKLTVFNVILRGSMLSIAAQKDSIDPFYKPIEVSISEAADSTKRSFWRILICGTYIWHLYFCSVWMLRTYFFVSTFEKLLDKITNGDRDTVNKYINIFGIAQLVGILFAPVLGPYMDKDEKLPIDATYDEYRKMKIRKCAIALFITNSVTFLTSVTVLMPYLQIQIVSIIAHVISRGLFFAVHFTFFAAVFPPEHYGKLSCLSLLIGVLTATLQYPLCILVEEELNNDPFWVNVGFLLLVLTVYGQSMHLLCSSRKKESLQVKAVRGTV